MSNLLLAIVLSIPVSNALIGYDCAGSHLNTTTISLLDTGECAIDEIKTNSTQTYVQLLQLSDYQYTDVIQCKVEISRTIFYCGMHSHISAVQNGQHQYLLDINHLQCTQMHREGAITLGQNNFITGLKINSTVHRSLTMAGTIGHDGKCAGIQYSDPYGTWDNVVVQAVAKITLKTGTAAVKLAAGKIKLQSGTVCELTEGFCIDMNDGQTFWQPMPTPTCNFDQYDVLYQGNAVKTRSYDGQAPTIYSLTTQDITFALTTTTEQHLCGYVLLRTEHPKLFILETNKGRTFKEKSKIPISNLDIFTYVNSKFVYVEKHIRSQLSALYNDIILQKCNLERQVIKNALAVGTLLPDEFAFTIMKKPGYMAITAGEVAHVVKCIPIEVVIRRPKTCYSELPVTHRNESLFLSPKSRILTKFGTQRECSHLLPVMYKIEGTWFRFTPNPIENIPPEIIKPLTKPKWRYLSPDKLATSGIYSEGDIEELRDHIMFPAEKPALLNNIARGVSGQGFNADSISMYNLLDEKTLKKIVESTTERVWSGFITFGSASAGILGIFIIIRIIKLVIDTIIHGYALHTIYGWSLHLLGAIWGSITHLLLHLGRQNEVDLRRKEKQQGIELQDVTTEPRPSERRSINLDKTDEIRESFARIDRIST